MKLDGKTIYAQSSDIKARTYLEYRKDMKKKAIAELEVLQWLESKIKEQHPDKRVRVYKSGGDKFLWFLRQGGISREPDFVAQINEEHVQIEFQYGGGDIQEDYIFDFKTSKVASKVRGQKERVPKNTLFVYLFRGAPTKFAFISAKWIHRKGVEGVAPAWGNREVYKITGRQLLDMVEDDPSLAGIWASVDAKLFILDFQNALIDINKERLSYLLKTVIDENRIVQIVPKDLDSFFKVCFILDNINKLPQNANLWLIYVLSYLAKGITLEDISRIVYCIDFLYSKVTLKPNELPQLVSKVGELLEITKAYRQSDGSYRSSLKASPLDETRYALFAINLLEDLIQDMIFYYSVTGLKPVKKIYENLEDIRQTHDLLKEAL